MNREAVKEAKDFLESEFYKIMMENLKARYVKAFSESNSDDFEVRERAYTSLRVLQDFDKELRIYVDSLKFI